MIQHFGTTTSTVLRLSHHISLIIILPSAYLCMEQEMYVKPNRHTVPLSRNHCCRGKTISIAYSECVSVALLIQHAKRMHHICTCSLTLLYLSHYLSKDAIFQKKYIEHEVCGEISSTNLSELLLILQRILRNFFINMYWPSCKVPVILVRLQFSRQIFRKIL